MRSVFFIYREGDALIENKLLLEKSHASSRLLTEAKGKTDNTMQC